MSEEKGNIHSLMKTISETIKRYSENPLLVIEDMSKGEDNVTLFFHGIEEVNLYREGKPVVASTERFLDNDIMFSVAKKDVWKVTDGFTLAHLNNQDNTITSEDC
ncbi:hypothetical protein D3C81_768290 [compost metagenome]